MPSIQQLIARTGVCLLLAGVSHLSAQDEPIPCADLEPRLHVGGDASFTSKDIFIGGIFYYGDAFGEGYSFVASFDARPYGRKVLIQQSPGVYLYLSEERFTFLLGVDKQLPLSDKAAAFATIMAGGTFPHYRGSSRNDAKTLFPVVTVGLQWSLPCGKNFAGDAVAFRVGGQFIDLPSDRYRMYFSFLLPI